MKSAASSAQSILRASVLRSATSSAEWPMINSAVVMILGSTDYFTRESLSWKDDRACREFVQWVSSSDASSDGTEFVAPSILKSAHDETNIALRNRHGRQSISV